MDCQLSGDRTQPEEKKQVGIFLCPEGVVDRRQEAGQASVLCWRSKKDGQVFYESAKV